MKLSIIIVNWNTGDLLAQCVQSIVGELAAWNEESEIMIVDNASTDGSTAQVEKQFQQVKLQENAENVGFARANNQAIHETSGEYVLLLNPDTVVKPGALQTLVSFMDAHQQAGAAGARILNPDGTLQTSAYPAPTLSRELWYLLHLDLLWPYAAYPMHRWQVDISREVDSLLGACIIVRRKAIDEVGVLDDGFFMYSEEIDLCYRLRQAHWTLHWIPQARVVHYGGQSTRQVASEMFLQLYQSKLRFLRKHYGHFSGLLYKLVLLLIAAPRVLSAPLALIPSRWSPYLRQVSSNYARLIISLPAL